MELKNKIKLLKVIRLLLWILFGLMVFKCIVECIYSLQQEDWHPIGLLWEGMFWDVFKLISSLLLAINIKPDINLCYSF